MITCKLRMSNLSNDVVLYLYKTLMFYFELASSLLSLLPRCFFATI